MTEQKHLTLPILGMTCANCVATVERNLKKVDGVESANVNLSSERAAISYDPTKTNMGDFITSIERAGYEIAMARQPSKSRIWQTIRTPFVWKRRSEKLTG